jgi:hypothetical protein
LKLLYETAITRTYTATAKRAGVDRLSMVVISGPIGMTAKPALIADRAMSSPSALLRVEFRLLLTANLWRMIDAR